MLTIENKATQIDSLLNDMAIEVQLDKTRYNKMISSYEAIKTWIESDDLFFKPYKYEVYPHGSVRTFTTVKPIGKDEFDLDIVVHFKDNTISHSPMRIYNELKRRLEENAMYSKMLESKSRVLRLNYAGDFHMDLMCGIQHTQFDQNKIKVPDRELGSWVSSNPRGYADWFMDQANLAKSSVLEKALKAEQIQADNFNSKKPLQIAVQLIKRYRDIYFEDDDSYKTRSIILTTIAGQLYSGEESIFDTVDNIIAQIQEEFRLPARLKILNPVNTAEDFTDKWDGEPDYYDAFKAFIKHLYHEWQKLKEENGVIEESTILKGLFGDKLVERVNQKGSKEISDSRKHGGLGITRSTGTITNSLSAAPAGIKKNTFFGK